MNANDHAAIERLTHRFADALNLRDSARFSRLWADEATWSIGEAFTFTGTPAQLAEIFDQRIERWQAFVQVTHCTIADIVEDTAAARSYVSEIGKPAEGDDGYFNYGMYVDCLVRTGDGWRFARRDYHYLYLDRSPLSGNGFRPPPDL
jgi:ketosteroid isomerase-like protein